MRVRATATQAAQGGAIGQVELSCSAAGLCLGLYGLATFQEGYAPGAPNEGTELTVPWHRITSARSFDQRLHLELDSPHLPFQRITLTRFVPGPGVPRQELRRRRRLLWLSAITLGALASFAIVFIDPRGRAGSGGSALALGAAAAATCLALGAAVDRTLLTRPADERATRESFLSEFRQHYPGLLLEGRPAEPEREPEPIWTAVPRMLPSGVVATGLLLAAAALTAFVSAGRMGHPSRSTAAALPEEQVVATSPPAPRPTPAPALEPSPAPAPTSAADQQGTSAAATSGDAASVERRCLCDRADSPLWKAPIPKLSALLLEQRAIPTKTTMRTQLEIAIVNNSDTPMEDITLHVLFFERKGEKRIPTKERPLYFEGPLDPAEAIKWTTEARGTEFELLVPDFGNLGTNGDGAARADQFVELLEARHRPVRLHGARILSFLGDPRARDAALQLKDAMRAAEAAYLRRILMATGDTRVCDVEVAQQGGQSTVGVCVYNARDSAAQGLGVQLQVLSGSLDVGHPLADPPSIVGQAKWPVEVAVPPQTGQYVRVPLPPNFLSRPGSTLEVLADRYDLLD